MATGMAGKFSSTKNHKLIRSTCLMDLDEWHWKQSLPVRSLLCYHQTRWDQQEPPSCWIQRRKSNTILCQGETSLLVSFNTIKEGLKATKQCRPAPARTRVSTSAYLRTAFDVLGLRACKLQHSSKAHWKRAKVKTRDT